MLPGFHRNYLKEEFIMATWKNLDTLASYDKLKNLKNHVNIAEAMSGEKGAERVMNYSTPRTATREEGCIAKAGDFIAIAQVDLPQGLHPFRAECRDKNLYVELSELTRWSQSASEQSLSALLRFLLPFD